GTLRRNGLDPLGFGQHLGMMQGEVSVKRMQGCQALIARSNLVAPCPLDHAQELQYSIGSEIGQVQSCNRSSTSRGHISQEEPQGVPVTPDGPGPKPSLNLKVIFEKGEEHLPHAAHWAPPFGAKARKR